MIVDKTDMDKADYEKYLNYYNRFNAQNSRRSANGTSNRDEYDALSDKKTNIGQENVQMEDIKENSENIDHFLDNGNISNVSKQKSDGTTLNTTETNENSFGSLDPFSAFEKLISISTKTKKQ